MKKYVITGSTGHISKPIAEGLIKAGKEVSIITSSADKVKGIDKLGAKALVGSLNDAAFLKKAFEGADVIYTMIPPLWQVTNWRASQNEVGNAYVEALQSNQITHVVNLSSIGAHLGHSCGPVNGIYDFEQQLNRIPGLHVKHLRPSFFYYNLLNMIGLVKQAGILGANYGDQKIALVHTNDIAAAALEELVSLSFKGNSVRYIVSDERTGNEIAAVLGKAIGKPLPWVVFTDEQQLQGLLGAGVPPTHAAAYVEMGAAQRTGILQEDMLRNKPALSPTKLEDFANEFVEAYNE
ncbi:MAG: NAD-dependent dehydratase [Azospira oryzae]|jgi:uncharacterized protein YbjT (DUF2867 family)|nr:MAG: NAD-dependent dehydratase [Azospira oryzae]